MFKQIMFVIAAVVCMSLNAHAHDALRVQHFEVELSGGVTVPIDANYLDNTHKPGPNFGLELRYNFSGKPWACGMFLDMDWASWEYDPRYRLQDNRTLRIGFLGEYNFRQGRRVNPFASMGIGLGLADIINSPKIHMSAHSTNVFVPKVGVEFYRWLRLNAFFQISEKGYNIFGFTLGVTIGGRPRQ